MSDIISIAMPFGRIEIELIRKSAPLISRCIEKSLPHQTIIQHCTIAGAELLLPLPFLHDHENRAVPKFGDVGYATRGNYMCIYYGRMSQHDGETNIIGKVRQEGLSLERVGQAVLRHGALRAVISAGGSGENRQVSELANASVTVGAPWSDEESLRVLGLSQRLLEDSLQRTPLAIRNLSRAKYLAMGNQAARFESSALLASLTAFLVPIWLGLKREELVDIDVRHQLGLHLPTWVRAAQMLEWIELHTVLVEVNKNLLNELLTPRLLLALMENVIVAVGRLRQWVDAISPWHLLEELNSESRLLDSPHD